MDNVSSYEKIYRQGRECKFLWTYIPKRIEEAIDRVHVDSDGYWIYLNEDWVAYDGGNDCGTIHEYNIKDLKFAIKTIRKGRRRDGI